MRATERRRTLVTKEVDGYVAQVERLVVQGALARSSTDTAEVFLWCAWRCLEAMLRALLVPYPPKQFAELDVKGLLDDAVQRTLIPVDLQRAFEAVWGASQAAVRVREHTPSDRTKLVPECSESLAKAARWFFERSPAKRALRDDVSEGLGVLAGVGGAAVTSRDAQTRARQARLIDELDALVAERQARLAELGKAADGLATHVASERRSLAAAVERLAALRTDLAASEGFPRSWTPPARDAARSPGAVSTILGPALALLVGAVVGYLVNEGAPESWRWGRGEAAPGRDEGARVPAAAPGERGAAPDAGRVRDGGDGGRVAPARGDAGRPRCAESMIEVAPAVVRLVQPYPRRSWPAGPKELPPVSVERFCLDRDPVPVESYDECAREGACRARSTCLDQPRDAPITCVSWADAAAYCRWRGGELPSVAQWERTLLPGGTSLAKLAEGTWEWTADPFPAPVFERGPAKLLGDGRVWGYMTLQKMFTPEDSKRPLCSWHKAPSESIRNNLSFRCVVGLAKGEGP